MIRIISIVLGAFVLNACSSIGMSERSPASNPPLFEATTGLFAEEAINQFLMSPGPYLNYFNSKPESDRDRVIARKHRVIIRQQLQSYEHQAILAMGHKIKSIQISQERRPTERMYWVRFIYTGPGDRKASFPIPEY